MILAPSHTRVVIPPPTASLTITPSSQTTYNNYTVSWTSTNGVTATLTENGSTISTSLTGSLVRNKTVATTYTYVLTVTNSKGQATDTKSIVISLQAAPTVDIWASPTTITIGNSTTLYWNATGTSTSVYVYEDGQAMGSQRALSGSQAITPPGSRTYKATAFNADGTSATDNQFITTVAMPTVDLTGNPLTITTGNSTTLSWTTTGATSINVSGSNLNHNGTVPNGSVAVTPAQGSQLYTAIAYNAAGSSVQDTQIITVSNPNQATYNFNSGGVPGGFGSYAYDYHDLEMPTSLVVSGGLLRFSYTTNPTMSYAAVNIYLLNTSFGRGATNGGSMQFYYAGGTGGANVVTAYNSGYVAISDMGFFPSAGWYNFTIPSGTMYIEFATGEYGGNFLWTWDFDDITLTLNP